MTEQVLLRFTTEHLHQARQQCTKAACDLAAETTWLSNKAAELAALCSQAAAMPAPPDPVSHAHVWACAGALACMGASIRELQDRTAQASQAALELHRLVGIADHCELEWDRERARTKAAAMPPPMPQPHKSNVRLLS
jgi:uncharacterized protein (DUF3084 family)